MKTVVIGAGLAGLSALHKLPGEAIALEKENRPGGLARTEVKEGFVFDYTGHLLHLRNPEIEKFILPKMKARLNKIKREAYIFSAGVYTPYPYQINTYGLPAEIAEENIAGFIKASLKNEPHKGNFRDWVMKTLGEGFAKNFMLPYNEKFWKYPLDKLTLEWLGRFVPAPSIDDIICGALPKPKETGYNAYFYYPETGGIESVVQALHEGVKEKVRIGIEVKEIDLVNRTVYYEGGSEKYDFLISTMPLNKLLKATTFEKLKKAAEKLKGTSVYGLNIGFRAKEKTAKHWVYVPEKKYVFYRVGFPHNFAPANAPDGMSSLFAEVSFTGKVPDGINDRIIKGLVEMGVLQSKNDIITMLPMIIPDAYVVYNKEREETMPEIKRILGEHRVYTAGRWGNWEYSSMEDAVVEGFEAAERVRKAL